MKRIFLIITSSTFVFLLLPLKNATALIKTSQTNQVADKQDANLNLIINWTFNNGINAWSYWVDSSVPDQIVPTITSGVVTLKTGLASDGNTWHYQLYQQGLSAEPNVPYTLKFKSWSDVPRSNSVDFEDSPALGFNRYGASSDPEANNGRSEWVYNTTPTPKWYTFHVVFDQMVPETVQKIQWNLSTANATTYLDSIILSKEGEPVVIDPIYLYISSSNISLEASASDTKVGIQSNIAWQAHSNQPWVKIDPENGTGDQTLNIKVDENTGSTDRIANITVSSESYIDKSIYLKQKGKIQIAENNGESTYGEQWDNSVWTTYNLIKNWNFTAGLNNWAYWVDVSDPGQVEPNTISGVATMETALASDGNAWHYQLFQQGLSSEPNVPYTLKFKAWSDAPRSNTVDFEDSSAQGYNRYGASSDAGANNGRSEWAYYTTPTPKWYTFHVVFDQMVPETVQKIQWNLSTSNATTYLDSIILFRDGVIPFQGLNYCNLSETDISFESSENSKTFSISSDADWNLAPDQSWIEVTPESGSGNATITAKVNANPFPAIRTANIKVTSTHSETKIINLSQKSNPQQPADPGNNQIIYIFLPATQGTAETFISSIPESPVFSNQSWLKVNPTTGSGEQKVVMVIDANESLSSKKATITVFSPDAQFIEVTQSGKEEIAQNSGDPSFGEAWTDEVWSDYNLVKNWDFATNIDFWSYWVDSSVPYQDVPYVLSGNALLKTGLASDGNTWHYQLYQQGLSAESNVPYILKFKSWSDVPRSNSVDFEDSPAQAYNRYGASSDPEANNGRSEWVYYTTTTPKWYSFHVVFDQMVPETVQKIQWNLSTANSTTYLDSIILIKNFDLLVLKDVNAVLSATQVTVPPTKSRAIININSNTKCMAISDQLWLAVDPSFISGTQSINLMADENTSSEDRSATVTIFPAGLESQTITVKQASVTAAPSLRNAQTYSVYPNPTSGKVKLKFNQIPQSGIQLSVFDLKGKTIFQQLIHNQEEWIDLKGNSPGVYFIKTNQGNQTTQKLILK